jgi:excisionase family DNA binding protein
MRPPLSGVPRGNLGAVKEKPYPEEGLVNHEAAARFLGVAPKTIRKMTSEGRIPFVRLSAKCVRYSLPDLRDWIAARTLNTPVTSQKGRLQ